MTRVLVFGSGGIGTIYGYLLYKAGAEVTAVCRSNYEIARTAGFTIKSTKYGEVSFKPRVVRSVEYAERSSDFIVVTVKSLPGGSPSQAEILKPAVGARSTIVIIQNGIGVEEEYANLFPHNPILSCVTYLPVTQTSPGVMLHPGGERLQIGAFPAENSLAKEKLKNFAAIMKAGGSNVEVYEDIQAERWAKLVINAPWNPITALSRSRDAHFLKSSPEAVKMVRDAMLEVASVARAVGYKQIGADLVDAQLDRAKAREPPRVEPSMMADALNCRAMEVEAIIGNTLRIAKQHRVETPILSVIYVLTKALDSSLAREKSR